MTVVSYFIWSLEMSQLSGSLGIISYSTDFYTFQSSRNILNTKNVFDYFSKHRDAQRSIFDEIRHRLECLIYLFNQN